MHFSLFFQKLPTIIILLLMVTKVAAFNKDYAEIGIPVTEVFEQKNHKGTGQNWWMIQGNNGYIYNGTGTGLSEWDGEKWRIYPTPNKTLIRSLNIWKDGRIYVGTTNDIGYYEANEQGQLTFYSLVEDWPEQQRQFGQVWSTAANQHGVVFVTRQSVYFWNGIELTIIQGALGGIHRVFALKDSFIYKLKNASALYQISANLEVRKTQWHLPDESVARLITLNTENKLVAFTSRHGIFAQRGDNMELRIESQEFGENVRVYNGIQATDGYYYVATLHHGLFIINKHYELVRQYTEEHDIGGNKIYAVMEDAQGNIWLSGAPNIIKLIPPHKYSRYQTQDQNILANEIGLFQNKVTVAAHGFHQFQLAKEPLGPAVFSKIPFVTGAKWDFLEYKGHFVYAGEGGVSAREINNGVLSEVVHKLGDSTIGRALFIDPVTRALFATTVDGIYINRFEKGKWQSTLVTGLPNQLKDEFGKLSIDDDGIVWVGTETQTLYRIENAQFPNKETTIQKFTDVDGLGPNDVIPHKLSAGIVIGTNDGLMNYQAKRQPALDFVEHFPELFTTKGQDINRLYEDKNERIWYRVGSHAGYIEKDSEGNWQSNEDIFNSFVNHGNKGFLTINTNILWFVSSLGHIYRVNLDLITPLPSAGILNIRQIANVDTGDIISGGLNEFSLPPLTQQNNSIRINYALAENSNANSALYRHKLIGSQNESWSKWLSETDKDFTNLAGADYRFMLQAKDGWGRISTTELDFSVIPPWYLSQIAWLMYVLLLLTLLVLSGWTTQRWRTAALQKSNVRLENEVALRTTEVEAKAEQLQQQQVLKDRFFSNVSHEFRTPLTLTIMPLQDLLRSQPNLDHKISFPVEAALRNSQKMLELVGQVLDINRLESGQFPLNITEYDISDLVNRTVYRFTSWAEQHQQVLSFNNTDDPTLLFYDQDQIEKCVSNLISNAIKYSGNGSHIQVSLLKNSSDGRIGIEVKDNGKGISVGAEKNVFERFYQEKTSEQISEPGTGIGLSLVQELITLHHGEIELINRPTLGCTFVLWLKQGSSHFDPRDINRMPISSENSGKGNTPVVTSSQTQVAFSQESIDFPQALLNVEASEDDGTTSQTGDVTTLLIVDDNSELRHFLALRLSSYYRIIEANNGSEGVARAKFELPDLIISDVMMPIKNGLEMVKEIKAYPETSTIPIILLTAKSSKRETVDGLQTGADDYLTKPFDTSELIVRVAGLLNNRKKLRDKIEAERSETQIENSNSQYFSDKLRMQILLQITQADFSIDNIAKSLALSRRSLNRKCQQELKISVGHFITEVRMQNALSLLKKSEHKVSEVAYATGYESLAYFSRAFKKFYGKSPTGVERPHIHK
jgi:signal transduction histidine kinase/DNA-binding response OmpR family regulator